MTMKKIGLVAAALAFAGIGGGGLTQNHASAQKTSVKANNNKNIEKGNISEQLSNEQSIPYSRGYDFGSDFSVPKYSCSPKEYGQYLQRTGRQKWVKKSSKKPR